MEEAFSRTELLLGKEKMEKLRAARVAVFGIGGVGGYTVEALVRSGVGALDLIDSDRIAPSNLNRQIIALRDTLGEYKVDAAKARIASIAPDCAVRTYPIFYTPETAGVFDFAEYDYVVDAIDTVSAKIDLVMRAQAAGVPIISSMGAGNKLDPTRFEVADIYKTSVCPLARVMRTELRRRGVKRLKVVYSTEPPSPPAGTAEKREGSGRPVPGSAAFVPSVVGLILAAEVIRDLTKDGKKEKIP